MPEERKRVFIAFAMEDITYRDFLVGQARLRRSPFDFLDFSVKQPWEVRWKTNCRTRIKGCDGVIGLISRSTLSADGQLWELKCAFEEGVPTMLMYVNDDRPKLPIVLEGKRINVWSWANLESFIDRL